MHEEFKELADTFGTYAPTAPDLTDAKWRSVLQKIQVVMPAGGESKRLRGVTKLGYNKISAPLPNGDTLIEHNIRMYRDAGLQEFILLVGHEAGSVEKLIGNGSKLGIQVRFSHDPEKPVGTGGAVRLALDSGLIDTTKYLITHNAGDIFFGYPGSLPRDFVSHHIHFEKQGSIATVLTAPMSLIQGSGLKINNGFVEKVIYEPYVPVPYHTAATVFSPASYAYFKQLFVPGEKIEFERSLFPALAAEHKLTAMKVDNQYSLQVKNEKQWEQLMNMFGKSS
ncbi:MAG: NTP transferase domain-containing protein [Candidatus Komeilibacteria bacterium]|nr:NTP transferase domain-containing protein [Candidatus Komeilibacteria bacterium]